MGEPETEAEAEEGEPGEYDEIFSGFLRLLRARTEVEECVLKCCVQLSIRLNLDVHPGKGHKYLLKQETNSVSTEMSAHDNKRNELLLSSVNPFVSAKSPI